MNITNNKINNTININNIINNKNINKNNNINNNIDTDLSDSQMMMTIDEDYIMDEQGAATTTSNANNNANLIKNNNINNNNINHVNINQSNDDNMLSGGGSNDEHSQELNTSMGAHYHGPRSAQHIGRKPAFGQTCSMKTLLQDGILETGEKVLTLEFGGSKFYGDLRKDGTIEMRGPDDANHIYATPVAWANYCCKMLNPESKPLNAWSSIRFKGKRLDSYKLKWYRAQKKPTTSAPTSHLHTILGSNIIGGLDLNSKDGIFNGSIIKDVQKQHNQQQQHHHNPQQQPLNQQQPITNYFPQYENPIKNKKLIKSVLISNNMDIDCKRLVAKSLDQNIDPNCQTVIAYDQLGTRGPHNTHDPNTMIKCIPFSAVDRIQPFNVQVSTNALLLIDFHSHLVSGEVAGYLAGEWDVTNHVLSVKQAFPCRTSLDDESSAASVEEEIRQDIEKRNLTLVGWYHSHQGKYSNHPTIKDIQNQLDYQITMKEAPSGYTPCIGLICSPHDIRTQDDVSPSFQLYWVMPPPEHLPNHYGRPMQMYYSVNRDLFLTQDLLLEMRLLANYYTSKQDEFVDFKATYEFNDRLTNLDKLSGSIKPKLPKDLQESEYPDEPGIWKAAVDHFWKFLHNLVVTSNADAAQQQSQDQDEGQQHQQDQAEEQEHQQDQAEAQEHQQDQAEEQEHQHQEDQAVDELA